VKLHALAWRDTANLCTGPTNLGALQLLPEARSERFAQFWSARARLRGGYGGLVAGVVAAYDRPAAGSPDSGILTDLVFGLVESVITWFDHGGTLTPAAAADDVALGVLRLVRPGRGAYRPIRHASARLLAVWMDRTTR
jgi:hypothetical protein